MFRRIGEYISLNLFYFVNLTSSCSLIPRFYVYATDETTALFLFFVCLFVLAAAALLLLLLLDSEFLRALPCRD